MNQHNSFVPHFPNIVNPSGVGCSKPSMPGGHAYLRKIASVGIYSTEGFSLFTQKYRIPLYGKTANFIPLLAGVTSSGMPGKQGKCFINYSEGLSDSEADDIEKRLYFLPQLFPERSRELTMQLLLPDQVRFNNSTILFGLTDYTTCCSVRNLAGVM